ncbi:MAG: transglutaminase-like domain-containing protein, partial [Clostridia bacterium]|nr:transglutaminase-like domain-containing protein [Clostridia bacterium]
MYAQIFAREIEVQLEDENGPFLYPNQYVDFDGTSEAVEKAAELAAGLADEAAIAKRLYRFVADHTDYDYEKAETVQKGYLPDPDETLASGKGICFDYSALLATMLRAQGIPAQMVIGVVMPEGISHAWNRALLGGEWVFMDATFDGDSHREEDYTQERVY